jgi:hypothetical protein
VDPFSGQDLALRASDADRDRIAAFLREAFAEGRLDAEEHHERVEQVYSARTLGELTPLVADLPGPGGQAAAVRRPDSAVMPVAGATVAAAHPIVAIFGGAERGGHWVVTEGLTSVAVFGGVSLDMRLAELEAPQTTITAVAVFGGVDITVPDGVEVKISGFSIFGGSDGPKDPEPMPLGSPILHVRAFAVFGGVSVRRKKPRH